jgi:hypothetical protein
LRTRRSAGSCRRTTTWPKTKEAVMECQLFSLCRKRLFSDKLGSSLPIDIQVSMISFRGFQPFFSAKCALDRRAKCPL